MKIFNREEVNVAELAYFAGKGVKFGGTFVLPKETSGYSLVAGSGLVMLGAVLSGYRIVREDGAISIEKVRKDYFEGKNLRIEKIKISQPNVAIDNGKVLHTGRYIGMVHVESHRTLEKDDSMLVLSREIFRNVREDLVDLAAKLARNRGKTDSIGYLFGYSHIVGALSQRLGFETCDFGDKELKDWVTEYTRGYAKEVSGKSEEWALFDKNHPEAKIAYISVDRLLELYSKG